MTSKLLGTFASQIHTVRKCKPQLKRTANILDAFEFVFSPRSKQRFQSPTKGLPMNIKNVVVAGGGVLGSQIAFQAAYKGFNVKVWLRMESSIAVQNQSLNV